MQIVVEIWKGYNIAGGNGFLKGELTWLIPTSPWHQMGFQQAIFHTNLTGLSTEELLVLKIT